VSQPKSIRGVEKLATVGCWKLEQDKQPHVEPIRLELARAILSLAARVPFEAERTMTTLYDMSAKFDDGSAMLFSFKPYSSDHHRPAAEGVMPRRRDAVDMRFYSAPFRGAYGAAVRLGTIVRSEDFRIEKMNELVGGRKITPAPYVSPFEIPAWQDLDWEDVETACPIQAANMVPWLERLGVELDNKPRQEFEELAARVSLTA
jgi:hypothetical protein